MEIILASASPRRRELLVRGGIVFTVDVPRDVREISDAPNPRDVPKCNAARKAEAAARLHPDALVVGADTVVICENRILGKPCNSGEAREMLRFLSGKTHEVITAVALRSPHGKDDFSVASRVTFRTLTPGKIEKYLSEVEVLDKAGSYAVQEHGDEIISAIEGDYDNIVGLPSRTCDAIAAMLRA